MIPKITHQVWVGPNPLPDKFASLRRGLLYKHEDWTHILWNESMVEAHLCKRSQYEHYSYAGQSNLIRLHALKTFGGIYLDLDFEILKRFDDLLGHNNFVAKQPDGVFCNAFMGAEKDSKWITDMIENYGNSNEKDAAWGCHIIHKNMNPTVTELPTEFFYPYNWDEKPLPATDKCYAVHLWEGSWLKK